MDINLQEKVSTEFDIDIDELLQETTEGVYISCSAVSHGGIDHDGT